jgi:hypothetical protein
MYDATSELSNVGFKAVAVTKGRKFKGKGFLICVEHKSYQSGFWHQEPLPGGGCHWTQWVETSTAKIWVPELGKCCYANAKFVEDDPSNAPKCEEEFVAYCEKMISDTVNYCANKLKANNKFSIAELVRFAKRCLNKYHTEISNDIIDKNLSSLSC